MPVVFEVSALNPKAVLAFKGLQGILFLLSAFDPPAVSPQVSLGVGFGGGPAQAGLALKVKKAALNKKVIRAFRFMI